MQISDISIWGITLLLLLTGTATALSVVIDRRIGMRLLRAMSVAMLQLLALGGLTWSIIYFDKWWIDILWLLALVLSVSFILLQRFQRGWQHLFLPLSGSMFISTLTTGACLLLTFSKEESFLSPHLLIPVIGLLLGHQHIAVKQGLRTYLSSLRHTTEHRQYLLSCGATHLESIMPSARRALRSALLPSLKDMISPFPISLPLVFCGMILCEASPAVAILTVWLLLAASFTSTVITLILTLWLSDRWLFDGRGNLLVHI